MAKRLLLFVTSVLATTFLPTMAFATPTFPFPWPDYSVVPVLFVPTDWSATGSEVQAETAALNSAMAEIQQWYAAHNGGRTFVLNNVSVYQAQHAKEYYGITWGSGDIYVPGVISVAGSFEGAVMSELWAHGYATPPAQNQSGYSTVIFAKGAGGWAGSREYTSANGGQSILGDWAIDSIQGTVAEGAYSWGSGRRMQTGAVAHELGHSFGLPHPDQVGWPSDSTIMGNWGAYPTIGLNDYDRSYLLSNKAAFFTVPAAPSNPTATALSGSSIRVNWTDNSPNETSFEVSNGVTTVTVGANTTSYTWGGLAQGTYMCFHIRARGTGGVSPWTSYACTTTPTVPTAPGNQTATPISSSQIRVNWSDQSGNETGFRIYDGVNYFTVGANVTTFTRSGLASRTYMCFAIQSYNAAGYSAWTPYACTTTL